MLSPTGYSAIHNEELNLVAYHVRVLEKYNCIELRDTKQRRGATEHFYSIVKTSPVVQAVFSSGLLGGGLKNGQLSSISPSGIESLTKFIPVQIDRVGRQEIETLLSETIPGVLTRIQKESSKRGKQGLEDVHVGLACFTWDKGSGRRGSQKPKSGR